ncbi:GlxA family transcriptional regulator [Methylobacterium oxalidis]|uniref:Transcriptional regulator n=1 Tax=Methylobacterium oxalidis TaxID=944322 RepID=A0A512J5S8_9HYPH|nr:helix-turn-helix domain-containing protein [Methylobacterium oxalidis]GEP05334.1 transcriptional regulator [Methylobacterium oxalidis]GJE31345.1 HTH-type transcriptional regulator CdhR [Methylobacterium oxalidis]GLS63527.1 transcriptional regulator [Methylobacterium oxalidis]
MLTIGVLAIPELKLMSLAALSVFQAANGVAGSRAYEVRLVSERGGSVPTNVGFGVETEPVDAAPGAFDTFIIGAFTGMEAGSPALLDYAARSAAGARRVASFCTGVFVLAEIGLLGGRRATTHWLNTAALQARYPDLRVETDRIFVNDGTVWTSAGMTASIDMALALVEDDLGRPTAREVARRMLLDRRRFGAQPQASSLIDLEPRSDRIQRALDFARLNLREALTVSQLAEIARLSPRQFSRAFHAELGQPPAKVIERLRADAARVMLAQGRHSLEVIAAETGFADRERMRRAFLRIYGRNPGAFRRETRLPAPA